MRIYKKCMIVVCYVNDLLEFTEVKWNINCFREEIQTRFVIKDRCEPSQFFGMEIKWLEKEKGQGLRQTKMIGNC